MLREKSINGYYLSFLGRPYTETATVSVNLNNNTCVKTTTSGTETITETASYSNEKQFCYGAFYYPIWNNQFSIDQTAVHAYIDGVTNGLIAVVDVKNNHCYLRNQADRCTLTKTVG